MAVDGFHLMCLADPEPASSVLSTTHLPKTCSHIYIRSSIPSWQHGRHSDHIRRYGVECAHAPCPHRPIVLPARQPSTSSNSRTHTELDETTPRHSVISAGFSKHRSWCLVLHLSHQLQTQHKWAARNLCKSRLTIVRGHHFGTCSHWGPMDLLTAGIAPNTDGPSNGRAVAAARAAQGSSL